MEALELFREKGDIITVSRGPQFKAKGGTWLAMFSLAFFIFAIVFLVHGIFITSFIFLIISFLSLYYILDIHGLQLNRTTRKIRDYKSFLWFKTGQWENMDNFKSIYITKNYLVLPTYTRSRSETYHYYHVKLVDRINKKEFLLAEYNNYYKAFKISKNIAYATGLELVDMIKGEGQPGRRK